MAKTKKPAAQVAVAKKAAALKAASEAKAQQRTASFRTWAAEQTNFAREVAEQALAHTVADKVERTYKRTTLFDKRRALMAAWAKYCTSPPPAAKTGNVVANGDVR